MTTRKQRFVSEQTERFGAGQIDRRTFVSSLIAAGVALPAALSMSSAVMAATPKQGGKLRQGFGHGSTTDTLDPGTHENGMSQNVVYTYANHLTEVSNTGELIPELAESYEASDDASVWRFNIRQGVEFHNGKTMTPADVVASLNHHRGEDTKSAAKGLLEPVTDISIDGNTVVVTLKSGNADFPFIVSDYHIAILPSDGEGNLDWGAGIGTGAYSIVKYEPGVRGTFKRNPNYWKEGRGHFDEVETLSLLDTVARQNAVMNGDVDVIDKVDPKTVALLGRVPSISILETTGTQHYTFPMRLNVTPFDNFDLRMALKLAIDRQELVDKILLGHGAIGNDHPISSSQPFHASDLPQRAFDADKAREHYEKSGHSGAIQLSASDAAFAGAVDAAQLIKASAAKAGIEIEVVREPSDGYWSNVWNKKGWCACYWGGRPTADWMYSSAYVAESEWNDTAWRTTDAAKEFNDLVVKARVELDPAKRTTLYARTQELINVDGGAIVPMWANHIHALSKKLAHDEQVAGNWQNDGNKSTERWWFA